MDEIPDTASLYLENLYRLEPNLDKIWRYVMVL